MSDFQLGMIVGFGMWFLASIAFSVRERLAKIESSEPPAGEDDLLSQEEERPALPMKDAKGRTMWDREDPYVPKPKRPVGDDS